MEFMNKYLTRKNLFYTALAAAVLGLFAVLLVGTLQIDDISQVSSGLSTLLTGTYFYEACFLCNIILAAGYAFLYFNKKEKTKLTLILMASAVTALVLQLFTLNMVMNLQKLIHAINSGNLLKLAGVSEAAFAGADVKKTLMIIAMLIDIALGAYLCYMKYGKKVAVDAAVSDENLDAAKAQAQEYMASVKQKSASFLSTKKGIYTIAAAGIVVVLVIAFVIFQNNKKTDFDVTKNCELVFSGDSGEGRAAVENCKLDYDLNDDEMKTFVHSIRYEIEGNGDLKNGDTVKAVAVYSEETAKSLKLNIVNPSIENKVNGLKEYYASLKDIPDEILKDADKRITDYVENEAADDLYFSDLDDDKGISITAKKVLGKYFVKEANWSGNDAIIYLYKVSAKGKKRKSWLSDEYVSATADKYFYVLYQEVSSEAKEEADVTKDTYYTFGDASDKGMIEDFKKKYDHFEEIK